MDPCSQRKVNQRMRMLAPYQSSLLATSTHFVQHQCLSRASPLYAATNVKHVKHTRTLPKAKSQKCWKAFSCGRKAAQLDRWCSRNPTSRLNKKTVDFRTVTREPLAEKDTITYRLWQGGQTLLNRLTPIFQGDQKKDAKTGNM